MPQTVEGLSGSCVIIPCTFSLPSEWDQHLDHSCFVFPVSHFLPDPPHNTSVSDSGPVLEGSLVILTCSTNANPEVNNYTWYKVDGEQVEAVGFTNQLSTTATEVDRQFFCQADNGYGSQNSSIASIDVHSVDTTVLVEPAGPVIEGSSVSLLCRSRSNPAVTNYTWYRDGEVDQETGPLLVLDNIDPSHSGGYRCSAKNDLGEEASAKTQLDVQCELLNNFCFSKYY
uniref:Ig-like domain-containing protein n=1 Tax=Poecilia reticulata TaxID=8081 RepID=A0A3P9PME0_POERE